MNAEIKETQIKSTMLDPLPDQLGAGVAYTVPEHVKADPGDLFAYIGAICYGPDILAVMDFFDVSRQTFWIWRTHGKGVPAAYREKVEALIAEKSPPYDLFRMPTNATVDDIMRPPRGQGSPKKRVPAQNHALIDLLHRICASPEFGHSTLKTLISQMARPVSNPYVFYRWAWAIGGVPRSYNTAFLTALMQLQVWKLYDYTDGNRAAWEGWAERALAAPVTAEDTEDDDDDI